MSRSVDVELHHIIRSSNADLQEKEAKPEQNRFRAWPREQAQSRVLWQGPSRHSTSDEARILSRNGWNSLFQYFFKKSFPRRDFWCTLILVSFLVSQSLCYCEVRFNQMRYKQVDGRQALLQKVLRHRITHHFLIGGSYETFVSNQIRYRSAAGFGRHEFADVGIRRPHFHRFRAQR